MEEEGGPVRVDVPEGNKKRRSVHAIKILQDPNPILPRWASMTSFKPSFCFSFLF